MVHVTKETKALLRKSYNITMSKKIVNGDRTYLIAPQNPVRDSPENKNGTHINLMPSHLPEKLPNGNPVRKPPENGDSVRRPSKFIKRNSTVPNDLKNMSNSRSFSLISNYRATQENSEVSVDDDLVNGKRHTFPSSSERRVSGSPSLAHYQRRTSGNIRFSTDRRLTNERKRRTAFMNNNIKRYYERLEETNKELEETIENMLLSKFE